MALSCCWRSARLEEDLIGSGGVEVEEDDAVEVVREARRKSENF